MTIIASNTDPGAASRLHHQAAAALAGRPVRVFIRPLHSPKDYPRNIHFMLAGQAYVDPDGIAVINIRPGMSENQEFETFLHEVAHHRLDKLPSLPAVNPENFDEIWDVYGQGENALIEARTDDLAREWLAAVNYAIGAGASIMAKLQWLLDAAYRKSEFWK